MIKRSVARQYANALHLTAPGAEFKKMAEQAHLFGRVLRETPGLIKVFQNPSVPKAQKEELVEKLGAKLGFEKRFISFVKLVVDKRRTAIWKEIETALGDIDDRLEGVARGVVVTAEALSDSKLTALEREISGQIHKKAVLRSVVNPSVLGGYKVKLGSVVFDGTFEKALEDIRSSLLKR